MEYIQTIYWQWSIDGKRKKGVNSTATVSFTTFLKNLRIDFNRNKLMCLKTIRLSDTHEKNSTMHIFVWFIAVDLLNIQIYISIQWTIKWTTGKNQIKRPWKILKTAYKNYFPTWIYKFYEICWQSQAVWIFFPFKFKLWIVPFQWRDIFASVNNKDERKLLWQRQKMIYQ